MNKIIYSLILSCSALSSFSFACDPASLDWEKFHKTYDLNK
ncbi:MAG: EF-hand domain-containing protein, partial [Pseudomonadota bacterium]